MSDSVTRTKYILEENDKGGFDEYPIYDLAQYNSDVRLVRMSLSDSPVTLLAFNRIVGEE